MYRNAFPKCPVQGSFEPKPFGHLIFNGAVPSKCGTCNHLFEGSCRRSAARAEDYQVLDHGTCPVHGETAPVELRGKKPERPLYVPKKCVKCTFLSSDSIKGYFCSYQKEVWGDFPRSLDWGDWQPAINPIGIEQKVIATAEVLERIDANKKAQAVVELKRLYPGLSTEAAIKCCEIFKHRLEDEDL